MDCYKLRVTSTNFDPVFMPELTSQAASSQAYLLLIFQSGWLPGPAAGACSGLLGELSERVRAVVT